MRERQRLDQAVSAVRKLENELADSTGLLEIAQAENDSAMVSDAEKGISALASRAEELRLQSMLSGEADANDTYLEIHAGAGAVILHSPRPIDIRDQRIVSEAHALHAAARLEEQILAFVHVRARACVDFRLQHRNQDKQRRNTDNGEPRCATFATAAHFKFRREKTAEDAINSSRMYNAA